jgi:integral membrane sensor domain MASE1
VSIWAPVVAALGASFLTGLLGFGTICWQQRRDRADAFARKRDAFGLLIAHSLNFTIRPQAMRNTMRARSEFSERLELAMRLRRPLDLIGYMTGLRRVTSR